MSDLHIDDEAMPFLIEAVNSKYDQYAFDAKHATDDGLWPGETLRALDALDTVRDEIEEAGFIVNVEEE